MGSEIPVGLAVVLCDEPRCVALETGDVAAVLVVIGEDDRELGDSASEATGEIATVCVTVLVAAVAEPHPASRAVRSVALETPARTALRVMPSDPTFQRTSFSHRHAFPALIERVDLGATRWICPNLAWAASALIAKYCLVRATAKLWRTHQAMFPVVHQGTYRSATEPFPDFPCYYFADSCIRDMEGMGLVARRTQIVLEDDLDGSPAGETVQFALDGVEYTIDLNTDHATQLREAMAPWVGVARRTGGRRSRGTASSSKGDLAQIREWARANGLQVSERGRISTQVREAYFATH